MSIPTCHEGDWGSIPQEGARNFPGGAVVKNLPANAGDMGSVPGSGRSPGEGNGYPLEYSCLRNPVDRGDWRAVVHRVAQSRKRLKRLTTAQQRSFVEKTSGKYILRACLLVKSL